MVYSIVYLRYIVQIWVRNMVVWAVATIVRNMNVMVSSQFSHIVHVVINTIVSRQICSYFMIENRDTQKK